eukprot:6180082-Pleurochrysis_carterae.AAC.5
MEKHLLNISPNERLVFAMKETLDVMDVFLKSKKCLELLDVIRLGRSFIAESELLLKRRRDQNLPCTRCPHNVFLACTRHYVLWDSSMQTQKKCRLENGKEHHFLCLYYALDCAPCEKKKKTHFVFFSVLYKKQVLTLRRTNSLHRLNRRGTALVLQKRSSSRKGAATAIHMTSPAVVGVDFRSKYLHSAFGMVPKAGQPSANMAICKIPDAKDNTTIHCATEAASDCLSPAIIAQCKAYQFHPRTPAQTKP